MERQEQQGRKPWTLRELAGKTIWEWMELCIVPLALALITIAFALWQGYRQDRLEDRRAEAEAELASERLADDALQTYLSQMGTLMLEEDLSASEKGSEVRKLARARTLTVLSRLDASRKTEAMQFLSEAKLVSTEGGSSPPPISLQDADLSGGVDLWGGNFTGAHLESADLSGADMRRTFLRDSWLVFTDLSGADLENADMSGVHLHVADFSGADLKGALGITCQELAAYGCILDGTTLPDGRTMPSGQAYEDLIKAGKEGK